MRTSVVVPPMLVRGYTVGRQFSVALDRNVMHFMFVHFVVFVRHVGHDHALGDGIDKFITVLRDTRLPVADLLERLFLLVV